MSAPYVLGQAKLGLSGEEPGLSVLSLLWQSRAGAGRPEAKEKGQRAVIPPLVLGMGQGLAWLSEHFWFPFQGRPGGRSGVLQRGLRAPEL